MLPSAVAAKLLVHSYPVYATHRAIVLKDPQRLQYWMHTWSVLGIFKATTVVIDKLLVFGEPTGYASVKLIIYIALVYLRCGDWCYTHVLAPAFFSNRVALSEGISTAYSAVKLNILNRLYSVLVALGNEVVRLVLGSGTKTDSNTTIAPTTQRVVDPNTQAIGLGLASSVLSSLMGTKKPNNVQTSTSTSTTTSQASERNVQPNAPQRQLSFGSALFTAGLNLWARSSQQDLNVQNPRQVVVKDIEADRIAEEREIEAMEEEYFRNLGEEGMDWEIDMDEQRKISEFLKSK